MHLYVLQKTIWVKNGLKDGVCACMRVSYRVFTRGWMGGGGGGG